MGRIRLAGLDDLMVVAAIRAGRTEGLDELARRHAPAVRGLLRRMGCDAATADDLAQDAFILAFGRLADFRGEGSFAGWLKRIAARLYLRRIARRKGFETPLDEAGEAAGAGPDPGTLLDLDQALATLSHVERLTVTLCHGAGLSHAEAAEALGLPLGTVKSCVRRALDKLRRHMEPEPSGAKTAMG